MLSVLLTVVAVLLCYGVGFVATSLMCHYCYFAIDKRTELSEEDKKDKMIVSTLWPVILIAGIVVYACDLARYACQWTLRNTIGRAERWIEQKAKEARDHNGV